MSGATRAALRLATDAMHSALHEDPLLSCLSQPRLSRAEYQSALKAFLRLYETLEEKRLAQQVFPKFSLAGEIASLRHDLGIGSSRCAKQEDLYPTVQHVLGGLYVAHGAAFGRSSFRNGIARALPEMPRQFMSMSTDTARWRALLIALEEEGKDERSLNVLISGANSAFSHMAELAVC